MAVDSTCPCRWAVIGEMCACAFAATMWKREDFGERVLPLTDDAFPVLPRSHFSPHKEASLRELMRYPAMEIQWGEFDKDCFGT